MIIEIVDFQSAYEAGFVMIILPYLAGLAVGIIRSFSK